MMDLKQAHQLEYFGFVMESVMIRCFTTSKGKAKPQYTCSVRKGKDHLFF